VTVAIPVPFNPQNHSSTTNAEGFKLGALYSYLGKTYRFCKNVDAVSITVGMGVCIATPAIPLVGTDHDGMVTADRSGGSDNGAHVPGGVYTGTAVIAQNTYFMALVCGTFAGAIDVGTSIGAGTEVMASSTDGKFITKTGTAPSFGWSHTAQSGGVFAIKVNCP
jgi:hypothetical protein